MAERELEQSLRDSRGRKSTAGGVDGFGTSKLPPMGRTGGSDGRGKAHITERHGGVDGEGTPGRVLAAAQPTHHRLRGGRGRRI